MTVTMREVAQHAGVSVKTVSNVVNGTGVVTESTKIRVHESLSSLSYRVNATARQLRSGRSGIVAVALPHLGQPYFAELAAELVAAANRRSITMLVIQTGGDRDAERSASEGVDLPATDGIILSPLSLHSGELARRRSSEPLVILGEDDGSALFPHVSIENEKVARTATEFLIGKGRRRIGIIGVQSAGFRDTSDQRLNGYREALQAAQIEYSENLLGEVTDFSRAEGARAAIELLDSASSIDALFCFNDLLAVGALETLRDRGISVPHQVSVIGIDDIQEGSYTSPKLTTVSFDRREIAETALDLILRENGSQQQATTVVIPHHIVERETT